MLKKKKKRKKQMNLLLNSLPSDKFLEWTAFKAFENDK